MNNTINIINKEIDDGYRFFYFDRRSFKLRSSKQDNKGSFYNLDVSDCIEIYLKEHTTQDQINAALSYYNLIK